MTGAAGFIGSHLCERLLTAGHQVLGVDAFTRFYARELKEANVAALRAVHGFELVERNLLGGWPSQLLRGADAVCHLAGRPGVRCGSPPLLEAGNVATTGRLLRACAEAGVGRVLLASSSSVYGPASGPVGEDGPLRPLSEYGRSKLRAERLARGLAGELGLELVVLRLFTVYGPRQRPDMAFASYLRAALRGEAMPLLGDGRQRRDFTYVGDAADAVLAAVERARPGSVLNVSGGRAVELREALRLLGWELGRPAPLERRERDAREARATEADLTRTAGELRWRPRVPLELGLQLQAERALALAAA